MLLELAVGGGWGVGGVDKRPGKSGRSEKPWRRLRLSLAAGGFPRSTDPQGWESAGERTWVRKSHPSIFTHL